MDYHSAITIRNLEKYTQWRILREDFDSIGSGSRDYLATPAGLRRRQGDGMLSNAMVFSADSFGEG